MDAEPDLAKRVEARQAVDVDLAIGARLVEAAENWARNRGAASIGVQAFVRGPARDVRDGLGYVPPASELGTRLAPPASA